MMGYYSLKRGIEKKQAKTKKGGPKASNFLT